MKEYLLRTCWKEVKRRLPVPEGPTIVLIGWGLSFPSNHPCVAPPHESDLVGLFHRLESDSFLIGLQSVCLCLLYWEKVLARWDLFTMARVFFPLIPTSTWMSPFITDLDFDLAMALISCIDPNPSSGSSSLSLSVREWMAFFFYFLLPSQWGPLHRKEWSSRGLCLSLPSFIFSWWCLWVEDWPEPSLSPLCPLSFSRPPRNAFLRQQIEFLYSLRSKTTLEELFLTYAP